MKRPGIMLREVLGSIRKKVATISYPAVKVEMPDKFRGRIVFHAHRCIGCKLCVKDCPSEAIRIDKVAEKQFEATIDLDRCVFCGQCVDSCNKEALESSKDYELASLNRATLRVKADIDEPIVPVMAAPGEAPSQTLPGGGP
jgi:formate hydrogenlyase subunit 6/NADH:ubiquinone oxidoreductase subunit I